MDVSREQFFENSLRVMNEYRLRGRFCDICFRIGNRTFPAHRLLLELQAELLFEVLGICDYIDQEEIVLQNVDVDIFQETLELIYFQRDAVNKVLGA